MKKSVCAAAALSLLLGCQSMSDVSEEATTRRVPQFDNQEVEVWKSIILPNQPLSMHRHDHPRAIIALRGGTLSVVTEAGDSKDLT